MSLSASVNDQRCRFNTKVAELRATQGKNVRMFTDDEYHEYLRKVTPTSKGVLIPSHARGGVSDTPLGNQGRNGFMSHVAI